MSNKSRTNRINKTTTISPNLIIPNADWDKFLSQYNGFGCRQLCRNDRPLSRTVALFGDGKDASNIYCRWCLKDKMSER